MFEEMKRRFGRVCYALAEVGTTPDERFLREEFLVRLSKYRAGTRVAALAREVIRLKKEEERLKDGIAVLVLRAVAEMRDGGSAVAFLTPEQVIKWGSDFVDIEVGEVPARKDRLG